ncbi:restriction endonuclease subunit S [Paenibacillus abyssi]|uniref:Restriction endonuclease subunit S n=1 Tax=Paenibacillus abyssi TaxID=1340531 RepID=A0A917FQ27_9BACL|nr:restriction endonuclease subunit S [Paenibacillus abyssi]GGF98815.1 hypothetical protein GCM10010916_15110 [Paenibacillus abyssi]
MSREQDFLRVLEASANLHLNMEKILEAKAVEAEKVRSWMSSHITAEVFPSQQELVKETMQVHEQLIEVIDGLTKLNHGMTHVLKVVLRHDADNQGGIGAMGSLGGMLGGGFDMEAGGK